MKFNYFNQGKSSFGIASIGKAITGFFSVISPRTSALIGEQLLMKPHAKRNYRADIVAPEHEFNLYTSLGKLHINLYGHGDKLALISHGWADNSYSFQHMIAALTKQGFRVAAIDHMGHGKSAGNKSHLLSFIESLEIVIEHFEREKLPVCAIVAHSMGAVATLNLPDYLLKDKQIVLLSSPVRFFEMMFDKVERVGISRKLLIRVLEKISRNYGKTWQQLTPQSNSAKLGKNVTFIHDKTDRFAPFNDLKDYLQTHQAKLITTEGLGHKKILSNTKVIQNITQILSS